MSWRVIDTVVIFSIFTEDTTSSSEEHTALQVTPVRTTQTSVLVHQTVPPAQDTSSLETDSGPMDYTASLDLESEAGVSTDSLTTEHVLYVPIRSRVFNQWVDSGGNTSTNSNKPTEAAGSEIIGSFAIFLVLFFLGTIIALDLGTLRRHLSKLRANVKGFTKSCTY